MTILFFILQMLFIFYPHLPVFLLLVLLFIERKGIFKFILSKLFKLCLINLDMKTQLHSGARWLFRFRGYFGAIILMMFGGWLIFPALFAILGFNSSAGISSIITILIICGLFFLFLIVIIAEIYARMAYNRWFYEFTDSNLKLERGIIWKRYSNVPYERVQNVDIHRGILARMLGFSSVMIQTAGYSGTGKGAHTEGYLPAVDIEHAEKIRDFLMKKISKNFSGGL